jgi:hypothetical protein
MPIDCNALCNDELNRIHNLIKNKNSESANTTDEDIQNANEDYHRCITGCNLRNHRSGGGNKKKYIGKTKSTRSRTRRRVHHRRPRTQMNHRKKTTRR